MTGLHVETAGTITSPVSLLFMHGGMGLDHSYFRPGVDSLADDYQLVFYDHRLNGRSSRANSETVDLETMATDAEAVARQTCSGEVVVVAHSFGAWVAMKLAERSPDLVSRFVLVAPGLSPTVGDTLMAHVAQQGTAPQQQALADAFTGRLQNDHELGLAWKTLAPLYVSSRENAALVRRALDHTHFSLLGFQRFLVSGAGQVDWQAVLRQLQAPVLVVGGSDDWLERDAKANSATISRLPPRGDLAMIEHCGHLPFIERPAAFCDAISRWVHATSPSQPA
jgi:proline iminopeptidase